VQAVLPGVVTHRLRSYGTVAKAGFDPAQHLLKAVAIP
jgi:hypothetical protein